MRSRSSDDLQCPVCASSKFSKVQVELPEGELYTAYGADVFKCARCSFRFLDRSSNASHYEATYKAA
jgi:hypothetical protein